MEPSEIKKARESFKRFEQSASIEYSEFFSATSALKEAREQYPLRYDKLIDNLLISHLRIFGKKLRTIPPDEWLSAMIVIFLNEGYVKNIEDDVIRNEIEGFYDAHIDDYKNEIPGFIKNMQENQE